MKRSYLLVVGEDNKLPLLNHLGIFQPIDTGRLSLPSLLIGEDETVDINGLHLPHRVPQPVICTKQTVCHPQPLDEELISVIVDYFGEESPGVLASQQAVSAFLHQHIGKHVVCVSGN